MLGDNSKVMLLGPDGFNDSATVTDAGAAAEGMYVTIGGSDPNALKQRERQGVHQGLQEDLQGRATSRPTRPTARRPSSCSRTRSRRATARAPSITRSLYSQSFPKGIIGSFKIDASGDPSLGGVTVDQYVGGQSKIITVINPPPLWPYKALG